MKTCERRRAVPAAFTCRMNRNGKERGVVAPGEPTTLLVTALTCASPTHKPAREAGEALTGRFTSKRLPLSVKRSREA